jgi:DNA-binding MarR family transcriptional regulator
MIEATTYAITGNAEAAHADEITLGVLATVQADANISQRFIARELGVALGLANAYLKRCVRKGFIKVHHVPRRRYAYYLTPQGFAEKSRLTGEYLFTSLRFFRHARDEIGVLLETCKANGWHRVALIGVSEIAEIATLCTHDVDVELVGIVDPSAGRARFSGLKVVAHIEELGPVDAVIVTAMRNDENMIARHCGSLPHDRILAPKVLRLGPAISAAESAAS